MNVSEEEFDPLKLFTSLFQKQKPAADPAIKLSVAVEKFLQWMETLDYSSRVKRMVDLGREVNSTDEAVAAHSRKIISRLEQGCFYERQLALLSCTTSKDKERIMRFCAKDPSLQLRQLASSLAITHCEDDDVVAILLDLKLKRRRQLLARLRREGRHEVIQSFLQLLSDTEHDDLRELMYFGSSELVKNALTKFGDRMTATDASRFAHIHPDLCIDFLIDCAKTSTREDPRLLSLLRGANKWLVEQRPDKMLELVDLLLPLYSASQLIGSRLIQARPLESAKLAGKLPDFGGVDLTPIIHKLPDEMVLLAAKHRYASNSSRWFRRLSPELRLRVFEASIDSWRNSDGAISIQILEQLPAAQRTEQARQHMELANLSTKINERLSYARLFSWDEAMQRLKDAMSHPDPANRSIAFFNLLTSLKFNRTNLTEALSFLHTRKNEPDPVREQYLSAISHLPPSIFAMEHLELLNEIIDDALKAQDVSFASMSNIGRLLLRLYPMQKEWVLDRLFALLKDRGPFIMTYHPCRMLDSDISAMSNRLAPIVEYWQTKERESEIVQFGRWLGKRLPSSPPIVEALCNLAKMAKSSHNSEVAAGIVKQFNRKRFFTLVQELLDIDASWSLKPLIYNYLSQRRQNLLTPYLGQKALTGRFATGKSRTIPSFNKGFTRWSKKQIGIYSNQLSSLLKAESSNYSDKSFAICRLCRLPEPDVYVLAEVSSLAYYNEAMRDLAIRQMADTDNSCGIPILLECLNDERARQAIYALRSTIMNMGTSNAMQVLKNVPRVRTTVFKEIVRLAGDTKAKEAFAWLVELEGTELHRDVRVALLRAFWNFPEQEKTWEILQNTIATGDPVYAETAIRIPADGLSKISRNRLLLLFNEALKSKDATTRLKTINQISQSNLLDPHRLLVKLLSACLDSAGEDECRRASWAIACLYSGREMKNVLNDCCEQLAQNPRNLRIFVQQLQLKFARQPDVLSEDCRSVCDTLRKNPKNLDLVITLVGNILPYQEFYELLEQLDVTDYLHFGSMQTACQCLSQTVRASARNELEKVEEQLRSDKNERLRRLGLAALCGLSNSSSGWNQELLRILRLYRLDQSLMVSSAAQFILPAAELAQSSS